MHPYSATGFALCSRMAEARIIKERASPAGIEVTGRKTDDEMTAGGDAIRNTIASQDAIAPHPAGGANSPASDASHPADPEASTERFIVEVGAAASVAALIEPMLHDLGFRLVRVTITGKEGKTLQIMAERPDGTITIDDCETISRQVSPLLDVHDPVAGAYRLEVSSPGIDRPLVRASDFEDWAGFEAKLELSEPVDGRRRFKGVLDGYDATVSGGEVRIECELPEVGRQVLGLPARLVRDAKLVLTDELIREALTRAKNAKRGRPGDGVELDETDLDMTDNPEE